MRKFALLSVIALSLIAPAAFAHDVTRTDDLTNNSKSDEPFVTLTVAGTARAKPDRAMLSAGVQTKAVRAADAMAQNATQMQSLLIALKAKGVMAQDIQTSSISLTQDYEYTDKGQIFKGYAASNSVSVRMKDIGKIGSVLDALVNAGATNVSGPSFMIQDDSALTEAARSDAMQQAAQLSGYYAQRAGFAKARLLSILDNQDSGGPIPLANASLRQGGGSGGTPIEPGEVARQVIITVTYAFEN